MRESKRCKKVLTEGTQRYYRNLFKKYLEGKELSEKIIDYVVKYPNKRTRSVFRHYIQYLYYYKRGLAQDLHIALYYIVLVFIISLFKIPYQGGTMGDRFQYKLYRLIPASNINLSSHS